MTMTTETDPLSLYVGSRAVPTVEQVTLNPQQLSELGRKALACAELGMAVFPVAPSNCRCRICRQDSRKRGKHPLTRHGHSEANTDPARIRKWWGDWPDANIGYALPRSLLVIDVDGAIGRNSLAKLGAEHGALPPTRRVRTAREDGGEHLYFGVPPELKIRNGPWRSAPGLDVKAAGGYVILPPSVHRSGRTYEWMAEGEPASAPAWLVQLLTEPVSPPPKSGCGRISTGQRNNTLTSIAGSLRRGGSEEQEILAALRVANGSRCDPPLPDTEVTRIARSIARYPPAAQTYPQPAPPTGATLRTQRVALRELVLRELKNYSQDDSKSPLWAVIRQAKANPLLRGQCGVAAWGIVSALVPTNKLVKADNRLCNGEDVRVAWIDAHDKINCPAGEGKLDIAMRAAIADPVTPPPERKGVYLVFLALAREMGKLARGSLTVDDPGWSTPRVFIPNEKWAKTLDVVRVTVGVYRQWAIADGYLEQVGQYSFTQKRATEFRVKMDRFLPARGEM